MKRDSILPAVAVLLGACALVAYECCRRSCRREPDVATQLDRPLQTWEEEGGALPRSPAAEPPGA